MADFVLLTITRTGAQRTPLAFNAAIGAATIAIALVSRQGDVSSILQVRTVILWIPLVAAYWLTVGMRASFFVPSDLPAAWIFEPSADTTRACWFAMRAAVGAYVLPRTWFASAALLPVVGLRVAIWTGVITSVVALLLAAWVASSTVGVPFTRAYEPGHAKLRTRWPLYLGGLYVAAYVPARVQLQFADRDGLLAVVLAVLIAATALAGVLGRRVAARLSEWERQQRDASLSIAVTSF